MTQPKRETFMTKWLRRTAVPLATFLMLALLALANPALVPLALAQNAPAPAAAAPVDPASPRGKLDNARNVIGSVEAALRSRDPMEAELQRLKQALEPLRDQLRDVIDDAQPGIEQARSQLEQLGAKPDKGAPESADLTRERELREKAVSELDEQARFARTVLVRTEQLITEVADRRRALFARELFSRSYSLFSLELWVSVVRALPGDMAALRLMGQDWAAAAWRSVGNGRVLILLLALVAAGGLFFARMKLLPRLEVTLVASTGKSQLQLVLGAILQVIAGTFPAALGCFLVFNAARAGGFAPDRFEPVLSALLNGIVFLAFLKAMTSALLAPETPERRFFGVSDRNAKILAKMAWRAALVLALAKFVESLLQSTAAALATSIVVRDLFAIAFALTIARALQRLRDTPEDEEGACLGPYVPVDGNRVAPFRLVGWLAVVAITLAALAGYISLATFLTDQTVWLFIVAVVATVLIFLVDGVASELLNSSSAFARGLQARVGLRMKALEQIGVLGSGFLKIMIGFIAVMLVLAPWGVESGDILPSLKAAFFGFKIGDVTLSLSSLFVAGFILTLGLWATRAVQGWLENRLLPTTDMDQGLRNSLKTGAGYIGFLAAGALAVSSLGLSLDKLTIVAGALSVGIGFGLQSVVSNFVSGLILLWERPIRVGDLIVAGEGDGVVRRINVRSTEIETADRSVVIIPNSNLISGVVKNRVRADRTGRIVIGLTVPRMTDPEKLRDVLLKAASAHGDVMRDPPPRVFFKKITDATLEFELVCIVAEIDLTLRVTSDLHFVIHKRLSEEQIGAPEREVSIKGLDRIEDTLEDIADAIEEREEQAPPP
jgi:potassium-dependent mechanosensitive channel